MLPIDLDPPVVVVPRRQREPVGKAETHLDAGEHVRREVDSGRGRRFDGHRLL